MANGNFLVAAFSSNNVSEVTPGGVIVRQFALSSARGVIELDNGNWLASSSGQLRIFDPVAGTSVQVGSGSGYRLFSRALVAPGLIPPPPAP